MTENDDYILEYLEEKDMALPPQGISYNLQNREGVDISHSTVKRRLSRLLEQGLVVKEYEKGGFYSITDLGRQYLRGEIDAEDLEA